MDPAEKRAAFERLKELAGNGRLVPEKRKKFAKPVREAVLQRQDGLCAACEARIFGRYDIDHIRALELGGTNDLSNLVALHPECHRPKTARDVKAISKCRRIEDREVNGPKPAQIKSRNQWPTGQKLRSRNSFARRSA